MIRVLGFHVPVAIILLCIVDALIMYAALSLGFTWSYAPDDIWTNLHVAQYPIEKILYVAMTFFSLVTVGAYYRSFLTDMKLGFLAITIGHLLALGQLAVLFYILPEFRIWLSALLPALALSAIGILISHLLFDRAVGVRMFRRRILVLGSGNPAQKIQETIARSPYLDCVACVSSAENGSAHLPGHQDMLDKEESPNLAELAAEVGAQEIVVAFQDRRGRIPVKDLLECRLRGIQVADFWTFIERQNYCVELQGLNPSWLIYSEGYSGANSTQRIIKRLFDAVVSFILLIMTFPVLVLAGLAIVLDSEGRPLYRQTRIGFRGRIFTLWKLRSMRTDAEADGIARWSDSADERVTRIGRLLRRLRIDELPQLFNVLIGDMSFIGPRPERPEIIARLAEEIPFYVYRHNMKPGISGWAQIHYPYGNTKEDSLEKLKFDLYYIKNYSLVLDLIVLLQTLRVIIWPSYGTQQKATNSQAGAGTSVSTQILDSAP